MGNIHPHRIRYWLHSSEKTDSPETFTEKVNEICSVYHEAETVHKNGGHTVSVDEMTGIQALEHKYPNKPVIPGKLARMEFEYIRHGTISLIEDGTLVIGLLTQPELYEKTVSNMVECKARGAYLMGLTSFGNYAIEDTANFTVYIPVTDNHFSASLAVIPLQLLGYYLSVARGLDVDKPRNLAKSVTVE